LTTTTTSFVVDAAPSLASLVADAPDRARLLDELGLDYCCHGQRSLAEACAAAGLDAHQVAASLAGTQVPGHSPYPLEPAALAGYIEAVHHAYLHAELPALAALGGKVAGVHGGRHTELSLVQRLVAELGDDLAPHLAKEERVLFPAIRALSRGAHDFPFVTVRNPVRMMTGRARAGRPAARGAPRRGQRVRRARRRLRELPRPVRTARVP